MRTRVSGAAPVEEEAGAEEEDAPAEGEGAEGEDEAAVSHSWSVSTTAVT